MLAAVHESAFRSLRRLAAVLVLMPRESGTRSVITENFVVSGTPLLQPMTTESKNHHALVGLARS
jgi:hypothetical protein